MSKLTFIIPNEIEIRQMFPNHSIELSCAQYPNKLIVTRGSMGAVYHNRTEFKIIDGIKVTPADTTGAGDAFNGGLAFALSQNQSIKKALNLANKTENDDIKPDIHASFSYLYSDMKKH